MEEKTITTTRRGLLRLALLTPFTLSALKIENAFAQQPPAPAPMVSGPYKLPPLPYDYAALEPHIDQMTMMLHHDKHHATYVSNLNEAVAKVPGLANKTPMELIKDLNKVPKEVQMAIRNNGGGHLNHTMFWEIMGPGKGGEPTGPIAEVIRTNFTNFYDFKKAFNDAGAKRFGSGWVWLVRTKGGKYEIQTTEYQDNPITKGDFPIFGNDVWEHAYYLKYNNRRAEYLNAWWNVLNWDAVNARLQMAMTYKK